MQQVFPFDCCYSFIEVFTLTLLHLRHSVDDECAAKFTSIRAVVSDCSVDGLLGKSLWYQQNL